jgi:sugar phosphate isomerase/epimerase
MTIPIAILLYSVREELEEDFEGIVRRIAGMGYAGVETAGFPAPVSAESAGRLFQELGLTVSSAHTPLPVGGKLDQALETAAALDCKRIICAWIEPERYKDLETTKETCSLISAANENAIRHGLSLGLHNHWFEFEPAPYGYPYQAWFDYLDPSVFYELDPYWIQTGGCDPVQEVARFGALAPLLHIKDGPADNIESPMVAVGQGNMDYPAIIQAAAGQTEWLIVELDRCATDMMVAVERSFQYLVKVGLGHGR